MGASAGNSTTAVDNSPVAVEVNGMTMSVAQFEKALNREITMTLSQMGAGPEMLNDTGNPMIQAIKGQIETRFRERVVQQLTLQAAARDAGITVSSDSVQALWKASTAALPDDTAVELALKTANVTREEIMEELKLNLTIEAYLKSAVPPVDPSETEVKAFFDENPDLFKQPETVHARHILISSGDDAEKRIREIRSRIEKGEDFAKLAAEFSIDGSAQSGGDLGSFVRGQMVPEFEKVAFSIPVGKVSQPVKTQFGWHLILVLEHTKARNADYALDREIARGLAIEKMTEAKVRALVEDLGKRAVVKMNLPEIVAPQMPAMPGAPPAP